VPDAQIGSPMRRTLVCSKHAVEGLTKSVALEVTKSESVRTVWRLVRPTRPTRNTKWRRESNG
jgi:hypothetical protein